MDLDEVLAATFTLVAPHLTERQRRLLCGAAARALGYGGVSRVARLAEASRPTVRRGAAELDQPTDPRGHIRQHDGPKRRRDTDPGLLPALDGLIEPDTRGDPKSPLRWTCKSTRELAETLTAAGHPVSDDTVGRLLKQQATGCSAASRPWRAPSIPTVMPRSATSTQATRLLVCADAGGSNGYRVRAWKTELARLATETGFQITVSHLPPGTSKWNRIEHRLFSAISMNWRGRRLESRQVIVELMGATTTQTGLGVRAELDRGRYPLGTKVDDAELAAVPLVRHEFHGEWNHTIQPAQPAAAKPSPTAR